MQHTGACVPGGSGGQLLMEGLTVVLKLVCDDVVHVDCTGQPRVLLCASDGKTYVNKYVKRDEFLFWGEYGRVV